MDQYTTMSRFVHAQETKREEHVYEIILRLCMCVCVCVCVCMCVCMCTCGVYACPVGTSTYP